MLELLIIPVLAVHLLTLNLASAGPMVCMWLSRHKHPDYELRGHIGQRLAWWSVWAFVVGTMLGGAMLLLDNPQYQAALARFSAKAYWNAAAELVFSLVCMIIYAAIWRRVRKRPFLHGLLALLSVTNLLYHYPPLMVILGKLTRNSNWVQEEVIERPLFVQLMLRSEVLALSMHFIVASFAVAIATVIWLSICNLPEKTSSSDTRSADSQATTEGRRRLTARSALLVFLCTILQLPIGIWVLMTLPASSRQSVMGGDWLASIYFVSGIVTTLLLLQHLMAISLGDSSRPLARRTVGLLALVVLLMTATLRE